MQKIAFGVSFASAVLASPSAYVDVFEDFVQTHGRQYTSKEKGLRLEIFEANMKMIEASNAKNLSYTLGVTPYTDLTFEEFRSQFIGGVTPFTTQQKETMTKFEKPEGFTEPDSIDWVSKGAVSSVKNQGTCGSCWTFSATGALEGAMVVAGRTLVELSQQDIVDCDTGLLGGKGCSGGNPAQAFGWVKSNGMCSAADYPYKCVDGEADTCTTSKCAKSSCASPALKGGGFFTKGDVTDYAMVAQSEGDLEAAVARQPVSVAIEADQLVFQHYTGGVLTDDACGEALDHAVLVVGYGVDSSLFGKKTQYWKVKNSWGASWGEQGYIRILKGSTSATGECGIRSMASYPTVKAASSDEVVV